jgi:hypothetical protein
MVKILFCCTESRRRSAQAQASVVEQFVIGGVGDDFSEMTIARPGKIV